MTHFTLEQWIDYVRGVSRPDDDRAMRNHLAGRCPECTTLVNGLEALVAMGKAEAASEIPEYVLRRARAIYQPPLPDPVSRTAARARLIFDSFRAPLAAGARSGMGNRQLVYKSGTYTVDLRQERTFGSARTLLVGQLADRDDPTRPLAGIPAILRSGRSRIGRTTTNHFGEFQLEYCPATGVKLLLGFGKQIALIELSDFSDGMNETPDANAS